MARTDEDVGRVEIHPARMGWKPRRVRSKMADAGDGDRCGQHHRRCEGRERFHRAPGMTARTNVPVRELERTPGGCRRWPATKRPSTACGGRLAPRGDVSQLRLKINFPVVAALHTAPEVGASAGGRTESMRGRPAAHLSPPHAPAAPPPLALPQGRLRGRAPRMARHKCNGPLGWNRGPEMHARQSHPKQRQKKRGASSGPHVPQSRAPLGKPAQRFRFPSMLNP